MQSNLKHFQIIRHQTTGDNQLKREQQQSVFSVNTFLSPPMQGNFQAKLRQTRIIAYIDENLNRNIRGNRVVNSKKINSWMECYG